MKIGNHAIFAGMNAFCSYDADAQAYLLNVPAIQEAGFETTNDCSLQIAGGLNPTCDWTVKVSVSNELPA